MSSRYVFGLYNVKTSTSSTATGSYSYTVASSTSSSTTSSSLASSACSAGYMRVYVLRYSGSTASEVYNLSNASYSSSTYAYGNSTLDANDTDENDTGTIFSLSGGYYKIIVQAVTAISGGTIKATVNLGVWYDATVSWSVGPYVTVTGKKVTVSSPTITSTTTYSQGTTFYNYLYGDSSDAYTTGRNTSGDYSGYWITYVGTDSITPTLKITKSGYKMTSTITASSSATYGGDIYYLLETACNERDYETAQDSQDLTYTETVGSDTVYYYSRVTAYCDGFTDETVTASYSITQTGTRYVWDKLDEEGGTSSGYVSSDDLDDYPLDAEDDDGYWYDYLGCDTPDATAVTATTTGKAGATVTLKITAAGSSNNVYGGTIYYQIKRYRRTSSSGSYTSSTITSKTTSTTVTTTIPTGGYYDCYYTVTTLDSYGYVGTTAVSTSVITIINNEAPTVSIDAIGTVTDAFDISITIADEDGDEMDVTLALDGTTLTTWTDQTDGTLSYTIDSDALLKLLNGSHTITVTVSDSSETTTATETFTKGVYTCSAAWLEAKETSSIITKCYMGKTAYIPDDAVVSMLITNDNGVTWEDATEEFLSGDAYTFINASADTPAFNFSLTVTRGSSGESGYIDDLTFILDTGEASEYGNTVAMLTHLYTDGTHAFTGLNGRTGMIPVQFKSTHEYDAGDGEDVTLDGEAISIQTATGSDAYFVSGVGIMAVVDTEDAAMTLQM